MDRVKKIHKESSKKEDKKDDKKKGNFDLINEYYAIEDDWKANRKDWVKKAEPVIYSKQVDNIKYTVIKDENRERVIAQNNSGAPIMIEVICNDRHGRKERIKCFPNDTILILKKLISAKFGTKFEKIKLQRGSAVLNDLVTLEDYEVNNGCSLEIYYK